MYSVLIVDDEMEIRQGLKLKIDADKLGLVLAGEASNGIEALERLEDEAYDIVITDMNMPVMDGVSFLETCRERYPDIRLVVITGYEDFQYARAALRHQASDYLLKPVASDELSAVLGKVTAELDDARQEMEREARARWELSQYYKEMKEHFIVRLVKGEFDRESAVLDRSRKFGLDLWAQEEVCFLTVGFRERTAAAGHATARTPEQFRLPLELICREQAQESGKHCEAFRDANYPGFVHFVTTESVIWLQHFAAALAGQVTALLGFELACGFGQRVAGFKQWKEGYLSALLSWNLSESELAEEDRRWPANQTALSVEEVKVIERYLERGELGAFEIAIRHPLQEAFTASNARFVKVIFQLYLQLESLAIESHIALENTQQLWIRPEMALSLDSVDKACRFLIQIAEKVVKQQETAAGENEHTLIDAVRRYIDENYMTDLNLTELAERFNYNPSYFSEMFKSKVGKTFIQYVTEARMAQAIRLLEGTQLSLWDIAELTGFSNASYFSSKFKRMYGTTPSDYRQRASVKIDSEMPKK